jgi:predicted nucleic acid-binding Zn finger protein
LKAEETADDIKQRFTRYSRYGSKLDRAVETVLAHNVKEHLFLPSGRKIYTVVGKLGDEFIDPEKPYCSCSNFFFRVAGHKDELCYHLLSYAIASESKRLDTITFDDEEYDSMLAAVIKDVFRVLDHSGGS